MQTKSTKELLAGFTDFADNQHLGFRQVRRRCDQCGEWAHGTQKFCLQCHGYVDRSKQREDKRKQDRVAFVRRRRAELMSKPPLVRFFIRAGEKVEVAYVAFISFLTAVMAALAG
jgi:hypothetical protein